MAYDYSVAWQFLSKRTNVFFLQIKLHALIRLGVSLPSFDTGAHMEWSTVWVSTKPLITEENWPGQGLNPGLPNDTPALYPLLHELMLTYYTFLESYQYAFFVSGCTLLLMATCRV
jgi:hypothetical protein